MACTHASHAASYLGINNIMLRILCFMRVLNTTQYFCDPRKGVESRIFGSTAEQRLVLVSP